jgi:hypothetical protein
VRGLQNRDGCAHIERPRQRMRRTRRKRANIESEGPASQRGVLSAVLEQQGMAHRRDRHDFRGGGGKPIWRTVSVCPSRRSSCRARRRRSRHLHPVGPTYIVIYPVKPDRGEIYFVTSQPELEFRVESWSAKGDVVALREVFEGFMARFSMFSVHVPMCIDGRSRSARSLD